MVKKIFKPKAFYSCVDNDCAANQSWPAYELTWTHMGWICDECIPFHLKKIGEDENGEDIYKPSDSPEWDGKTLEEYLKENGNG